MKTTVLVGKLTRHLEKTLKTDNPELDPSDIPLRVLSNQHYEALKVSRCYMGIQHRAGHFRAKKVTVSKFCNDGIGLWSGKFEIKDMEVVNTLDFFYSNKNHNDCFHAQRNPYAIHAPITDVYLGKVKLTVRGVGGENKGHIMLSEPIPYSRFKLFTKGFSILSVSEAPALNANNLRQSDLGSPEFPLDGGKIQHLPIRIIGKKNRSPSSFGNVIHCYDDVELQLDKSATEGTLVVVYKRSWSREDRLDNWFVRKAAISILR